MTIGVCEAKIRFSELLRRVAKGEGIVITRSGKPVARLVPVGPEMAEGPFGIDRGRIWMAPDFDELPKGFLKSFYGGSLPKIQLDRKQPKRGKRKR